MPHESRRRIRQIDLAIVAVVIVGGLALAVTSGAFNDLVGAVIDKRP